MGLGLWNSGGAYHYLWRGTLAFEIILIARNQSGLRGERAKSRRLAHPPPNLLALLSLRPLQPDARLNDLYFHGPRRHPAVMGDPARVLSALVRHRFRPPSVHTPSPRHQDHAVRCRRFDGAPRRQARPNERAAHWHPPGRLFCDRVGLSWRVSARPAWAGAPDRVLLLALIGRSARRHLQCADRAADLQR